MFQRNPFTPSGSFQIGSCRKARYIAETKIGQYFDRLGHSQHLFQGTVIENADPSHSDAFRTCGQPEVLNGATGTIEVRVAHRSTTQHMRTSPLATARHADIDRSFLDPFKLEISVERSAFSLVTGCSFGIGFLEHLFHRAFGRPITDHHKIPWLHESNRPGMVSRGQHTFQNMLRDRRRQKVAADITALKDRPINGIALRRGERVVVTLMLSGGIRRRNYFFAIRSYGSDDTGFPWHVVPSSDPRPNRNPSLFGRMGIGFHSISPDSPLA